MEISTDVGPISVLSIKGNVDTNTFRDLIAKGEQLVDQGYSRLILDLSQVDYISSAGLMALQTVAGKADEKGGRAVIAGLKTQVQHTVELAGFDKILAIFVNVADARASFGTV
jgi:anti-anti-sigma factor